MKEIFFLTLAEVVEIHADQIERYGGDPGIRDSQLLKSAIAQPHASFAGELFCHDLYEMAAAYAFHICQNHPFFDGNKRVALASALVFLWMNGVRVSDPKSSLIAVMKDVAQGRLGKDRLAVVLRQLSV